MQPTDLIVLFDALPEPVKTVLGGVTLDFGKAVVKGPAKALLNAARGQVQKRFSTPPQQRALQVALTEALVVTVRDLQPQTPELFAHYVDLFSQWLQRP